MHESESHDLNRTQHSPCQALAAPACWVWTGRRADSYNP